MKRPRPSVRLGLTLSYAAVFFLVGFLLIALSYVLLQQVEIHDPGEFAEHTRRELHLSQTYLQQDMPSPSGDRRTVGAFLRQVQDQVVSQMLEGLLRTTFIALAVATAVSVLAGWWMAGRMLRPIHEISTVARRLSASTLHERIALQGPQDELKELADTFDAMLARLERAFSAQRDFVANASHELRTPLAIMRTELDVTLADPDADADELRRMAETIRAAIARSEDVIDELLLLAESDELVEQKSVDLASLADVVAKQRLRAAAERGLEIRLTAEPAPVIGEEALLERLLDNLVDNAVRYATPDTAIEVTVRRKGDTVVLRVANEGEVITTEEETHLFERFYRRETSRSRRSGGSGLGLAIVAAIAAAHGGSATAEAPDGGGLVVTVKLPAAPAPNGRAPFA